MKKEEFLKQENVPEFIKEIVRNVPDDAEVNLMEMKVGRESEASSCDMEYDDGVDISAYLESIADRLSSLLELTDHKGRVSKCELDKALGQVNVISVTAVELYNVISDELKEGKKSCSQKE